MALIAHWPLDGNSTDYTVSRHPNEAIDVTYTSEGKIGQAAVFNGSTSYIKMDGDAKFNTVDASMSFSMWINPVDISNSPTIFSRREGCNNAGNWVMHVSSGGNVYFSWYTSPGTVTIVTVTAGNIPLNEWTHITWTKTWGEATAKLYINGIDTPISGDLDRNGTNQSSRPITIGAQWSSNICATVPILDSEMRQHFNGKINDVRVYDHILSAKEVKELAKAKILHYTFNKDDGNTVYDNSDLRNDGTLVNNPIWTSDSAIGNGSYDFDGINDVDVITSDIKVPTSEFSIGCWFKRNGAQNYESTFVTLIGWRYSTEGIRSIELFTGDKIYYHDFQGNSHTSTSVIANDNTWYHVFVTNDNSTIRIYVNGVNVRETSTNLSSNVPQEFTIGGLNYGPTANRVFKGVIDDTRLYATALSADDVLEIYNTKASIDNTGNLWANEFVEDYVLYNGMTLTELFESNLLLNSNFDSDISNWEANASSAVWDDGWLKIYNPRDGYAGIRQNDALGTTITSASKFYTRFDYESFIPTINLRILWYSAGSGSEYTGTINLPTVNEQTSYSIYHTTPVGLTSDVDFYIINNVTGAPFTGDISKFDNIYLLDIGVLFNGYPEPTQQQLDNWYSDYTRTKVNQKSQFITREFTEEAITDYEVTPGVTLTELFEDNNVLPNGNFDNGVSEWSSIAGADNLRNTDGFLIYDNTSATWNGVTTPYIPTSLNNYYFNADVKFSNVSSTTDCFIGFYGGDLVTSVIIGSSINTKWSNHSAILTAGNSNSIRLRTNNTTNVSTYWNNLYILDLTAIFGAGNEPTQSQMDAWYLEYKQLTKEKMKIYKNKIEIIQNLQEGA